RRSVVRRTTDGAYCRWSDPCSEEAHSSAQKNLASGQNLGGGTRVIWLQTEVDGFLTPKLLLLSINFLMHAVRDGDQVVEVLHADAAFKIVALSEGVRLLNPVMNSPSGLAPLEE
ncbi:MAG: hypothetical protein AB7O68_19455, partial [Pirellulales bacterium]